MQKKLRTRESEQSRIEFADGRNFVYLVKFIKLFLSLLMVKATSLAIF